MEFSIWSFAIAGVYRIVHVVYILYRAYANKINEWYTICMPIAIAAYTIVAFTFIAYLYTLQHGKEWPDIMILALFSVLFGVGGLHRWLQAF